MRCLHVPAVVMLVVFPLAFYDCLPYARRVYAVFACARGGHACRIPTCIL